MPKVKCVIDYTNINRMIKDLNKLEEREVASGFDETPHSSGLTSAGLANILENGTRGKEGGMHIPPRRFMEQAGVILSSAIDKEARLVLENTLKGKPTLVNQHLDKIAEISKDSIQESIEMQNFAELSSITLRLKKDSTHPTEILLENGELFENIITRIT